MTTDPTGGASSGAEGGPLLGSEPEPVPSAGKPALVDLAPWDGLVLSTTGAYWKLSGAFGRVHAWMDAHAVTPTGPALGLFYDDPEVTPPEECRYSICYPLGVDDIARVRRLLAAPADDHAAATGPSDAAPGAAGDTAVATARGADAGRLTPDPVGAPPPLLAHDTLEVRHFPAESAVVVEYQGQAADSPAVYALLASWVSTHGMVPQGAPRERYVAEPGTLGGGRMHARVEQTVTWGS